MSPKQHKTGRKHRRALPRGMAHRMAAIIREHKAKSLRHQSKRKRIQSGTTNPGLNTPSESYWSKWKRGNP